MYEPAQHLSEKGLTVWRIHAVIEGIFLLLFLGGMSWIAYYFEFSFAKWIYSISGLCCILWIVFMIAWLPSIRWRHWRYEVREEEVELKYGLFVIKRVLVPMVRVQHVNMTQGPILKKYHLAEISISTAATVHKIPMLTEEEATSLRMKISSLARVAEEDV